MKVIIYGKWKDFEKLKEIVNISLIDLGLNDIIEIEENNSKELKDELLITKSPALIIEEENINFKDMIFEWQVPSEEEIKSMFISIIWWSDPSCSPLKCASWCSCH